jgi:YfiH family protein
MALHTGEPVSQIVRNRRQIARALVGTDRYHFVAANQTHSDHVKVIDAKAAFGWEMLDDAVEDCDALVTAEHGVILTILTADCVPLLLYDPTKKVVAAVHAGWKGTKARIAVKTIETMQDRFGCDPSEILVGIAPSIGKCCYEVDKDVASHFFGYAQGWEQIGAKYRLDLSLVNKLQLLSSGVPEQNIQMSSICTACEVESFFSYRKERGCSGRFMSMIGIKNEKKDSSIPSL